MTKKSITKKESFSQNNDEPECDIFDDYFEKQDQNTNLKDDVDDQSLFENHTSNKENDEFKELQAKKIIKKESKVINFINKMNKRCSLKMGTKPKGYFAAVAKNLFKGETLDSSLIAD